MPTLKSLNRMKCLTRLSKTSYALSGSKLPVRSTDSRLITLMILVVLGMPEYFTLSLWVRCSNALFSVSICGNVRAATNDH